MLRKLRVPDEFQPPSHRYPSHQVGQQLEEYFYHFALRHAGEFPDSWQYLPVFWSNVYYTRQQKSRKGYRTQRDLQDWLRLHLNGPEQIFTLVQCDDGIYEALPEKVTVFGAGGRGDLEIPLLCDRHPKPAAQPRDLVASFLGRLSPGGQLQAMPPKTESYASYHDRAGAGTQVRQAMWRALHNKPGFDLRDADADKAATGTEHFRQTLSRSKFGLCPRGYGKTSFRLYETLDLGAVPVYIYDEPWLAYHSPAWEFQRLNWEEFCVLCPLSQLKNLEALLRQHLTSGAWELLHGRGQQLLHSRFTMEGMSNQILSWLQKHA